MPVRPFPALLLALSLIACSSADEPPATPEAAAATATREVATLPPASTATSMPTAVPVAPPAVELPPPTQAPPSATVTPVLPVATSAPAAAVTAGVQSLTVRAGERGNHYYLEPAAVTLRPGRMQLTLINEGPSEKHTFNVKNLDYRGELFNSGTVEVGGSGSFTFEVTQPGSYVFFCILYGHQNKGQEGVLTVVM